MTFFCSLCCPQTALFSFVFCHINYDMSWCYLFWFIFLGFLCFLYHFIFLQDWEVLSHNFIKCIFYSFSILLLWSLLGYVGILDIFSGFLKLFSFFEISIFAILSVWLSLFWLHKVLRWQRNVMRRTLYPPQIHQKSFECWANSTKQLLNAGVGHQALRKAAQSLQKEVGGNIKEDNRDKNLGTETHHGEGVIKEKFPHSRKPSH